MSYKYTEKEKSFVRALINTDKMWNASEAYKKSDYANCNDNTAGVEGHKLLKKPKIQALIGEYLEKAEKKAITSKAYVLSSLRDVAERCMQKEPVLEKDENGVLVESGVWKFDSSGANKALELLGKNLKLFTDKIEQVNLNPYNFKLWGKEDLMTLSKLFEKYEHTRTVAT